MQASSFVFLLRKRLRTQLFNTTSREIPPQAVLCCPMARLYTICPGGGLASSLKIGDWCVNMEVDFNLVQREYEFENPLRIDVLETCMVSISSDGILIHLWVAHYSQWNCQVGGSLVGLDAVLYFLDILLVSVQTRLIVLWMELTSSCTVNRMVRFPLQRQKWLNHMSYATPFRMTVLDVPRLLYHDATPCCYTSSKNQLGLQKL